MALGSLLGSIARGIGGAVKGGFNLAKTVGPKILRAAPGVLQKIGSIARGAGEVSRAIRAGIRTARVAPTIGERVSQEVDKRGIEEKLKQGEGIIRKVETGARTAERIAREIFR